VNEELGAPYRHPTCKEQLVSTPEAGVTTLFELFNTAVKKYGSNNCVGKRTVLKEENEFSASLGKDMVKQTLSSYSFLTYDEVSEISKNFGSGIEGLQAPAGSNICIFASTSPSWMISAQACFAFSHPVATVYSTLGEEAIKCTVNESDCSIIITDGELIGTLNGIIGECPAVTHIIYIGEAKAAHVEKMDKSNIKLV
jgi:long-chain acyl-CoA synthetase